MKPFPLLPEPCKTGVGLAQVTCAVGPASASGREIVDVTATDLLPEQPDTVLVTRRVYVPAASTDGVSVVAPLLMWPPLVAVQR